MIKQPAILLTVLLASLSGCATTGATRPLAGQAAPYVTLPDTLGKDFDFPAFAKVVRFQPRDQQAGSKQSIDTSTATAPNTHSNATHETAAKPIHAKSKPVHQSADDWLFQQPKDRMVVQLFSARSRQLAQQKLKQSGVKGHIFYAPADRWWFALLDQTFLTSDAARQDAGFLTFARDGNHGGPVIRRVADVQQWRCRYRQTGMRLTYETAARLAALCK